MKAKKITAILLIVLMLLSFSPTNIYACVTPDPTPITVTVNVDQKHGNDTHDFANYTLHLNQAQSDALALLSNISLSNSLYNSYGVLADKFSQPVNASDLYGDGQIVYQQIDATHYYVYILLKEGGPFYTVTFLTSAGGSFAAGAQTVFGGIENGTRWNSVPIVVPATVANAGYVFDSWTPSIPTNNPKIRQDLTYTASFVKDPAQWNTINFVSNGNGTLSGTTTYSDILDGTTWSSAITALPTPVAAAGFKFDHWSPSIPEGSSAINDSATYTAYFVIDPDQYNTINFVSAGNGTLSGTTTYSDILDGTTWSSAITVLPTPVAAIGFEFDYWSPSIPTGSSAINDSATYTAYFVAIDYTITYNNILPTDTNTNPASYVKADTPITLADAARLGYTFGGWYDNVGLTGSAVTSIADGTTGNLTYWAKWTQDEYTITYNNILPTDTNTNPASYVEADTPITLADASRLGYTFGGWYDNVGLTGSAVTSIADGTTGNLTYWAKWTQDEYSITYNNILPTDTNSNPATYKEDQTSFALNNAVRFGWTFLGWYDNAELSGAPITAVAEGTTGSLTYWAKWEKDASLWYDVNFTTNGHGTLSGTASYNDILDGTVWNTVITVPTPIPNVGYKLGAWSPNIPNGTSQIKSDLTFTYNFKAIKYDINYVLNGGINDWRNPNKYTIEDTVNFHNPYRLGYTFQGWYATSDFTGSPVTGISQGTTDNVKLYAKWEKDPAYWNDVNFTTDGHGTLSGTTSYTDIFIGTPWFLAIDSVPTPIADAGYEFNVWSPKLPKWYNLIWADATYMADFVPIDYSISYVLNGGINNAGNLTTYNIESSTITLLDPSYYGYTFLGWYDNEELTGAAVTTIPTGSTGDKTFYAKWEKDASLWYDVNFTTDGNGTLTGTTSFADILNGTIWNTVVTIPTATPKAGYVFNGWTPVLPAATSAITKDVTYKANFRAIVYDITYILNDGTNSADNPATYTVNSGTITFADPTREGYTFDGWYNNADFTGDKVTRIAAGSTGDVTLYAKWTANTIIDDNPVPLTPGTPVLTLIDLFCAILTLLGMIYMLTSKKNTDDENAARRRKTTRITGVVLAAVGVILFFITQPLVWNFRWVDKWTVLFIVVTLAQAAAIYIKNKANKAEATQE